MARKRKNTLLNYLARSSGSRREHEGRVRQPGVPAGPRNTPGYTPPTVAEHEGRIPQPGIPSGPRNSGIPTTSPGMATTPSRAPSRSTGPSTSLAHSYLLDKLDDLLSPGPTAKEQAEAAHRLGVKPKAVKQDAASGLHIGSALGDIAKDVSHAVTEAKRAPALAAQLPKQQVDSFLGRKTLGTPTIGQLLRAAKKTPLFTEEGPKHYRDAYRRNKGYAKPGPYQTELSPQEERQFRHWAAANKVPFDVTAKHVDYDMRGYWKATKGKGWGGAGQHFPDTFKTPLDTTFSAESRYSKKNNPQVWRGNTLVDKRTGQVIFNEKGGNGLRVNQRGKLTIPATRKVAQSLAVARQQVAQSGKLTGPLTPGQRVFSEQVARETGLNPRVIAAQALAEESGGSAAQREAEGNHNWLNIAYFDSGPGAATKSPVWSTPQSAAKATSEFLKGNKLGASQGIQDILATAHQPPAQQISAIANSGWATNPAYGQSIAGTFEQIGLTPTDPKAIAALKKAKTEARTVGIPTKAGDVERGSQGGTVFVRADAEGFVKWAQALLGTQEGSKLQLKWAAESGISAADPWCAAFIAAGIARRGLTPPPGAANSQSWMTWNQGQNIGTDITKAKPGDIIVIGEGDHIGLYTGGGNMIAGNWSDEVSEYPVASDTRGVEGIIRPRFSGKKVAVKESTVLPGAAIGPGGAIVSGPAGAEAGAAGGASKERQAAVAGQLPALSPLLSTSATLPAAFQQFELGAAPTPGGEGEGQLGRIEEILKRRRV